MFAALSNTTKYLVIGGIILALALIIGLWLYFSGKAAGKRKGSINLSNPGAPDGSAPVASEAEIRQMAQKLFQDMDGLNWRGHNIQVWQDFLTMSDNDVIRVYNEFNTKYQKETAQSLTEWVNSEVGAGTDGWSTIKPTVLQRFSKLKLI